MKNKLDINEVREALPQNMKAALNDFDNGFILLSNFQSSTQKLEKKYGSVELLKQYIAQKTTDLKKADEKIKESKNQLCEMYVFWGDRPWWILFFSLLPSIRKIKLQKNAHLLNQYKVYVNDFSDKTIENHFNSILKTENELKKIISRHLSEAKVILENYNKAKNGIVLIEKQKENNLK